MRTSLHKLKGALLVTGDGVAGKIVDLYVQTSDWQVRWLVVRRGGLLYRHEVLIPPRDVISFDPERRRVSTCLSLDDVRTARPGDSDLPASRRALQAARAAVGRALLAELPMVDPHLGLASVWAQPLAASQPGTLLMSCAEMRGYRILARDGEVGRIVDLILEDWRLRSLVADGRRLIRVDWISGIDWRARLVRLMTPRLHLVSRGPNRAVGPSLQETRGTPIP
jgi:hypothetical protein